MHKVDKSECTTKKKNERLNKLKPTQTNKTNTF